MSTTHPVDEVDTYLAAVRDRLSDLPEEECAELLDDVAAHVREVAEEHGAQNLRERLGAPAQFGDDLRASAGYAPLSASATKARARSGLRRLTSIVERLHTERVDEVWRRLEPGWWVVRGVLVAYLVLAIAGVQAALVPRIGTNRLLGLAVLVGGAIVSYRLAERRPTTQTKRMRRARVVGEVALVVFGLFNAADASGTHVVYYDSGNAQASYDPCLRDSAGRPIGNLFAFDSTGKLIPQFFLTDQAGRGIDNLCADQADIDNPGGPARTTYTHDVNGAPVYNVFPRSQQRPTAIDPSTGEPTANEPVPAPAVLFPQIATTTTVAPSG